MNKNILTIRTAATLVLTTVCTRCDGTGVEPPEETVVVKSTVVVDTWRPVPPQPPRWRERSLVRFRLGSRLVSTNDREKRNRHRPRGRGACVLV